MIVFRDELAEFARYRDEIDLAARRRGGRPRLPPALRTEPFSLRLTPDERHLVETAAVLQAGGCPATWARAALLDAARRILAEARS